MRRLPPILSPMLLLGLALLGGCQRTALRCPCEADGGIVLPERTTATGPLPAIVARPGKTMEEMARTDNRETATPPARSSSPELAADRPELVPPPRVDLLVVTETIARTNPLPGPPPLAAGRAGLDHAPDYRWLVGRLHYVHVRDVWRIRYASPEDDDRYGGVMTLIEPAPMTGFRNGQLVRVEGHVLDPDSPGPSPAYVVRIIEPILEP